MKQSLHFTPLLNVVEDKHIQPVDLVPALHNAASRLRRNVIIDVIHDGDTIPRGVFDDYLVWRKTTNEEDPLTRANLEDRDWGASAFAAMLARALSVEYFCKVNIARVAVDCNCCAGIDDESNENPVALRAVGPPLARSCSPSSLSQLLMLFDSIHEKLNFQYERWIEIANQAKQDKSQECSRLLRIAVHTYDQNSSSAKGSLRPDVSIVRSVGNDDLSLSRSRKEHFDSVVPRCVLESITPNGLVCALVEILRKQGLTVEVDRPYHLSLGSLDLRLHAWVYLRWLREYVQRKTRIGREISDDIWTLLLDAVYRNPAALRFMSKRQGVIACLFSSIGNDKPATSLPDLQNLEESYGLLAEWAASKETKSLIAEYCRSMARPYSLILEIRRDVMHENFSYDRLLAGTCTIDQKVVSRIATGVAEAIELHLDETHLADKLFF